MHLKLPSNSNSHRVPLTLRDYSVYSRLLKADVANKEKDSEQRIRYIETSS